MRRLFRADAARREAIAEALATRLAGEPAVRFAYLHGSLLEGLGFHDIDVAVSLSPDARGRETEIALELGSHLSRLVGAPVDVRVLEQAPVTFRVHALHGRLLAWRDEEALTIMLEDTMRRYFDLAPVLRRATADAFGR
ncbi:MAG: nucleotidyltransferase domain-containing protein [Acidobacteria bacterium]|nr:nucleotidyltransferase domain-containing protein [Acidobacteriota bacterium]